MSEDRHVTFKTEDGLTLEGILHLPESTRRPGVVVCHPHPQYGGDMHNNVVSEICTTAVDGGFAALRFNFRGAGGSEGTYAAGVGERKDVAAALQFLRDVQGVDGERIALAGYSFGAAVALRSIEDGLRALVLVSLPTVAGAIEATALPCPALLISGDEDEFSDADDITDFAASLGEGAKLVLAANADHFWWGAEGRLRDAVGAFLKAHA